MLRGIAEEATAEAAMEEAGILAARRRLLLARAVPTTRERMAMGRLRCRRAAPPPPRRCFRYRRGMETSGDKDRLLLSILLLSILLLLMLSSSSSSRIVICRAGRIRHNYSRAAQQQHLLRATRAFSHLPSWAAAAR